MEEIKTINHRGFDIKIYQDPEPESPESWDDEYGFLIYDHRDFITAPHGMKPSESYDIFECFADGKKTYQIGKIRYWIFPVYAYIHGDISLYLSRRDANRFEPTGFDTSFKGFVLINKNFPQFWNFDEAYETAHEILKIWNQYLRGEVYGYQSSVNSCWGYYGDEGMRQAIDEAKGEIDEYIKEKMKEQAQKLKRYIKSKVPLQYRHFQEIF